MSANKTDTGLPENGSKPDKGQPEKGSKPKKRSGSAKKEAKKDLAKKLEKERDDKIVKVREQVLRKFGDGSIMTLGQDGIKEIPSISTGCTSLDLALGCGGVPRGRIVEIYGPESSGKTTLTLHLVAQTQKAGGVAAFIDAEHAIDPSYARKLGVDLDHLLVSQPDSGEQALEICEMLTSSGGVDIIVVDSVAALVPRAELEGEMGQSHVGLQARLMSQAMRKLTSIAHKSGTTIVFINQIREKIGVMFGSPETTTGGRALKFYSSVRLDIRRIGTIKNGDVVVGNRTRVKVVKNKMAAPFRQTEFDIIYNKGISFIGDLLDLATNNRVISKSGTWYSYGDTRLGQGRDRAVAFLEENQDICSEMQAKVMAAEAEARATAAEKTKAKTKK